MNNNIEFSRIKDAILNNKRTEEYIAWLHQDKKNLEMEARIRKYYEEDVFKVEDNEIQECWKEFEKIEGRKRGLVVRVIALTASVAAVIIASFLIFNLGVNDGNINTISNNQINTNVEALKSDDNIILKTENGEQYILKEENLNLSEYTNKIGEQTKYQTINVPKGKSFKLILSDSTVVYLNNNTEFTYPVNFARDGQRKVSLSGEAYFEVAEDINRQFIVETEGINIKVYGTKFNVNTNKTGIVETVLIEGSVAAQPKGLAENRLEPSQMLTFNLATDEIKIREVDVNNYVSWMSGIYRFNGQRLDDIMLSLSLWYDIEIVYEDNEVKSLECIFNIPRYDSIEEVLNIFRESGKIGCRLNGRKLYMWNLK